jgi:hypothetical protein
MTRIGTRHQQNHMRVKFKAACSGFQKLSSVICSEAGVIGESVFGQEGSESDQAPYEMLMILLLYDSGYGLVDAQLVLIQARTRYQIFLVMKLNILATREHSVKALTR